MKDTVITVVLCTTTTQPGIPTYGHEPALRTEPENHNCNICKSTHFICKIQLLLFVSSKLFYEK